MKPRRRSTLAILLFIALVGVAHTQATFAHLGILWRAAVLSWDNPATQLIEDLASQTVPHADSAGDLRDHTLAAARRSARVLLPAVFSRPPHPALARVISRAPPAA